MKKKESDFTPEDIQEMARAIGKPPSATLRAKVMAKIDQIDRETIEGKGKTTPKAPERKPPGGRDGIDE